MNPPHSTAAPAGFARPDSSGPTMPQAVTATLARLSDPTPPEADEVVELLALLHHASDEPREQRSSRPGEPASPSGRTAAPGNGSRAGSGIGPGGDGDSIGSSAEVTAAVRTASAHLRAGAIEDAYLALHAAADRIRGRLTTTTRGLPQR